MAGYSATPLVQKLGIKAGHRLAILREPKDFSETLGELPANVAKVTSLRGRAALDVIVFFTRDRSLLEQHLPRLKSRLTPSGSLWIAWPKKSSGVDCDLSENDVRALALAAGLVDNKVCAIDATWSGLRLVIRLKERPAS